MSDRARVDAHPYLPALHTDLEERILVLLPSLSPKRRRLARLLLEDPYAVAFASAEELGSRAGVDAATVVRFSRSLGFTGFSELKRHIQSELPHFATATEKLRQSLAHPDRKVTSLQVFQQDIANIERSTGMNAQEAIERAARLLIESRRTLVLSSGISTPIAWTLTHLLRLIGYPASQPLTGVDTAAEFASLEPDDVVVGISFWRYVRSTVEEFRQAKQLGRPTIAITDGRLSPLAQLADVALIAATEAVQLSVSVVGPISIVNALVTTIALARPERTIARLAQVDELYRSAGITIE
jgi:DNA-binding MurR/RpiR family transcriptional regulator